MKKIIVALLISGMYGCQKQDEPQPAPAEPIVQPPPPAPIITGTASFYIDTGAVPTDYFYYGFKLYINNKYHGTWNIQTENEPTCGYYYMLHYTDTAGTYEFRAEKLNNPSQPHSYTSTVTIPADGCIKIALKNQ